MLSCVGRLLLRAAARGSRDLNFCQKVGGSIDAAITELAGRHCPVLQSNFGVTREFLKDVQDLPRKAQAMLPVQQLHQSF